MHDLSDSRNKQLYNKLIVEYIDIVTLQLNSISYLLSDQFFNLHVCNLWH